MVIDEYSITIEKLMKVVHNYTDPIRIKVIMADAWMTCDEAKHMRDFELVNCFRGGYEDKTTEERLLKYYKDCPVWNLTVWIDGEYTTSRGRTLSCGIEARCHYKDIREGWLAEQADIRREKQREYRKRYKERKRDENNRRDIQEQEDNPHRAES